MEGKGLYESLEDKYYDFLDFLESKDLPVYSVVDAIESKNIPSFPVVLILLLAAVGILGFAANSAFFSASTLELTVQDIDSSEIERATVIATSNGMEIAKLQTDSTGVAKFSIPKNTDVEIVVSKAGYNESKFNINAKEDSLAKILKLQKEISLSAKTITVLQAGTNRAFDRDLDIEFSCTGNPDFSATGKVEDGLVEVQVPSNCDDIVAKPLGNYSLENETIFLSSENLEIKVSENANAKGTVVATVTNSSGQTVAGLDVHLYSVAPGNVQGSLMEEKQTSSAGTVQFSDVPAGTYYISTFDRQGNFGEYDGLQANQTQQVGRNATTTFAVVIQESVAGKIKVIVRDKATAEPIANAAARLARGTSQLSTQQTDTTGKAEFSVSSEVEYDVEIDKTGYLLKKIKVRPSNDSTIIEIEQATSENSQSLLVTVVDEREKPIENARVALKKNDDGTRIGAEIVTGFDGRASFERVDEGEYYVYAVKPGYGEKVSDPLNVNSRLQNIVKVKIPIGTAKLDVSVVDEQGNPIAGAGAKVVDTFSFQTLEESATDSDGKKSFVVRADKKAFVLVSAQGYANYITTPVQMAKDLSVEKHIVLAKAIQSFGIELDGLYVGNERVADTGSELSPGLGYVAKLRLLVPKNSQFDEAIVHVRTGSEVSEIEKDNIFISSIRAASNSVQAGTTFTPPIGQGLDFQHLTSGNSKWANVIFKKIPGGVYEVEADVQVRDEAKIGSQLELWYRAEGRSGGFVRSPQDAVLGANAGTATKQALFANANRRIFSAGPGSFCQEDFCASYSIEDTREQIGTSVSESYSAQIESAYKLSFEISGMANPGFGNSVFSVKDKTGSIAISAYNVRTALGENKQGQATGSELSVAVGDIKKDNVISGQINFVTKKEGTIPIEISIVSNANSKKEVYKKTILLKVQPANSMSLDIIPKAIVPLINNNILVRASTEGSSVPNAKINVRKNGEVVASGETDFEGIFAFTLNAPSEGSVLEFFAEKTGFKATVLQSTVSSNVIETDPKTLSIMLNVNDTDLKSVDSLILNRTQIPLQIEKIVVGKSLEGYAGIKISEPVQGAILQPDSNVLFAATLQAGARLSEISQPTKITGVIVVHVTNQELGQKWIAQIPIELNIGFGDELDTPECFTAFPNDWKIFGSATETQKLEVAIANTCKVGGNKVVLKNISVRLVAGNGTALGTFNASSTIEGSKALQVDKIFKKLADTMDKDAEEKIIFTFKPDQVISGKAEPKIEISATHFTERGEQKLVQKINVTTSINNLNECLEVLTDREIVVQSCPYNTGFGNYGNRFSQYGNSRYSQYDPYSSRYGYGTGQPPYIGTQSTPNSFNDLSYGYSGSYYPNSYQNQPFMGGADTYSPLAASAWNCGQAVFQVRNSCSSGVDLSFDAQPGVSVKERTVTVEAGKEADVQIEPTNFFGRYAVTIKAKPSNSTERTKDIKAVYVNVTNPFSKNYRDCISLNPSPKVQFNNFIGLPVYLDVINTCYAEGVYLEESTSTLFFPGLSIANPADVSGIGNGYGNAGYGQGSGTAGYGQGYGAGGYSSPYNYGNPRYPEYITGGQAGIQGNSKKSPNTQAVDTSSYTTAASAREMIESYQFLYPEYKTQPNGKVTQVLRFELIKAIKQYRNKAPPININEENPFKLIGGLRYFLTSGYYAVETRTTAIVRFATPLGMTQQIGFPMILQDWWNALDYAERISENAVTYGDGTTDPANCINTNATDFLKYTPATPKIPYLTKDNRNTEGFGLFIINDKKGCGTVDTFSMLLPEEGKYVDEATGLVMFVQPDPSDPSHELLITFNIDKWNGKGLSINHVIHGRVARQTLGKSSLINLNVKFNIGDDKAVQEAFRNRGSVKDPVADPPKLPVAGFACTDASGTEIAKAGHSVFLNYGFNNLLYEWRLSEIKDDTCDVLTKNKIERNLQANKDQPYFCDALQATISLSKKVDNIKKITENIRDQTQTGTPAVVIGKGECTTKSPMFDCTKKENLTVQNLYRYVLRQNSPGYFIKEDGKVIEITKLSTEDSDFANLKQLKDKVLELKKGVNSATYAATIEDTSKILTEAIEALKKPNMKGAELVFEVNNWLVSDGSIKEAFDLKTGNYAQSATDLNVYIPAESYLKFNEEILGCVKANPTATSCQINKINVITSTGTAQFLNIGSLYDKGSWKVTAKNDEEIGSRVVPLIREKGSYGVQFGDLFTKGETSYRNLGEFYTRNISTRMYLVEDNYTDNIVPSLKALEAYKNVNDLKIRQADSAGILQAAAGDYRADINFNFGEKDQAAEVDVLPQRSLAQMDIDNKAEFSKNILFTMPFDAIEGVAAGTSWNSDKIFLNSYTESNTPYVTPALKANSAATIQATYADAYGQVSDGKILSISKSQIRAGFSDPVKLQFRISKKRDEPSTLMYTLSSNNTAEDFQLKLHQDNSANYFATSKISGNLCQPTLNGSYDAFRVEGQETFNRNYSAIAYVPTRSPQNSGTSVTQIKCMTGFAEINRPIDLLGAGRREINDQAITSELTKALNDADMSVNYKTKYNLQNLIGYIDGINQNDAKICVSANTNTLDLYWNTKAFEAS